ncbi:MAG TPA: DUF2917 domain-containing protein [Burkholderiaceae bacterium]|jgi:hypothetical protein|nr:DUF2917 domain-containing protein [Burkholderiaceae bacterium]
MDTSLAKSITKLARGEILRVDNALGQSIAVVQGMLWITQEGDRRDIFLSDGDSFVFSRRGTALAQAVTDTKLLAFVGEAAEVIEPEPAAAADALRTRAAHIRLNQDLAVYARMAQVPAHQLA